jgi:hypothetical protein
MIVEHFDAASKPTINHISQSLTATDSPDCLGGSKWVLTDFIMSMKLCTTYRHNRVMRSRWRS